VHSTKLYSQWTCTYTHNTHYTHSYSQNDLVVNNHVNSLTLGLLLLLEFSAVWPPLNGSEHAEQGLSVICVL